MRSFLSPPRRTRASKVKERYQSKFKGGPLKHGNRDVHKFRRNRELLARELTTAVLWVAIAIMMIPLARTLWRVAQTHLADREPAPQVALPGGAIVAMIGCIWRARGSFREFLEIRDEQRAIVRRLQADRDAEGAAEAESDSETPEADSSEESVP